MSKRVAFVSFKVFIPVKLFGAIYELALMMTNFSSGWDYQTNGSCRVRSLRLKPARYWIIVLMRSIQHQERQLETGVQEWWTEAIPVKAPM